MKRVLSFFLVLTMLVASFAMQACAESEINKDGYGGNNGQGDDVMSDAGPIFDSQYAVSFCDFENITGGVTNTNFGFGNTGDSDYGNAMHVTAMTGSAVPDPITAKYNWNGQQFTLFSEPLIIDEKYLIYYDYRSTPTDTPKQNFAFSFSPKHERFVWFNGKTNDYRNDPKYYDDGEWHKVRIGFNATTNKTDVKLNSWGSNIESYIDNYLVMQAAEIVINDPSGTLKLNSLIDNIAVTPLVYGQQQGDSYMIAKGDNLSFKLDYKDFVTVDVKYNGNEVEPDANGVYTVNGITSDVTITTSVESSTLTNVLKGAAVINESDVYVPYGSNFYGFADDCYGKNDFFNTDSLVVVNKETQLAINDKVSVGDKVYTKYGDVKSDEFTVKFAGDADENGIISVSDITSVVDRIVNGGGEEKFVGLYDFDGNGSVNVTDIANIRDNILDLTVDTREAEAEIIVNSGVDIDFTNLENGIFNNGNRAALANVVRKALRGEEVILAAFGGSITAEGNSVDTPDGENQKQEGESGIVTTLGTDSYSDIMLRWFENTFSKYGATFKLINAGIGATDTVMSIHRMHTDVVNAIDDKKPDMVVYEWACNDGNYTYKQGTFENGIRKFIDEGIAVLIFCFDTRTHVGGQAQQEPIAKFYDLPLLSYNDAFGGLSVYPWLTNDGTHPNRVGHALAGTIITRYFSNILNNIDSIGSEVPELPEETYHPEANYYGETGIYKLTDIAEGKYDGIEIKDFGSFVKDTVSYTYGNNAYADANYKGKIVSCNHTYTGYIATQNEQGEYDPMVIEVDDVKTAFILKRRISNIDNCNYKVKVDGVEVEDPYNSFTCSNNGAGDHIQIENANHWASYRLCYNETPKKITIEILPDLGAQVEGATQKYIRMFALLLSK